MLVDISQLKVVNENTGTEYQESKVLCGQIDYQFAFGESFSFLLFATENIDEGAFLPDIKKYEYYKVGIMGAEPKILAGAVICWSTWRTIFSDMD